MNRLVLISTFCDTQEKLDIFSENVNKFKDAGLHVMAIGPRWLPIPDDVIKKCDFFYFTKENPLLCYPQRRHTHWLSQPIKENQHVVLHRGFDDYGWASMYQIKKLLQLGLTYDYDSFCVTIYDTVITDELIHKLLAKENNNILHKRFEPKNPDNVVPAMHFMIFDRKTAILIEKDITLGRYLEMNFAEDFLERWVSMFDLMYEEPHVTDKIYFWDNQPPTFDFQIHKDFKFFVSKHLDEKIIRGIKNEGRTEDLSSNIRLVLYDFANDDVGKEELTVELNGMEFSFTPQQWLIVEFPISSQAIKSIRIHYLSEIIDLTSTYQKLSFSQIYYNYDI